MSRRIPRLFPNLFPVFCLALSVLATQVWANNAELTELLDKIDVDGQQEQQLHQRREAAFLAAKNEQSELLAAAEAELAAAELRQQTLRDTFANNQQLLAELSQQLNEQSGELKEVEGVVRLATADLTAQLQQSMISAIYPQRIVQLQAITAQTSLPDTQMLRSLWYWLQHEMLLTGKISKQSATVVAADGRKVNKEVVQIGPFVSLSEQGYLSFVADKLQLQEYTQQPREFVTSAQAFVQTPQLSTLAVDPTMGQILAVYKDKPTLLTRIEQGGWVGYVIISLGVMGLLMALWRLLRLMHVQRAVRRQLNRLEQPNNNNALGRILAVYQRNLQEESQALEARLEESILQEAPQLETGISTIKLLAAVAPLLGLLGTVTGMIGTFQAITQFGTGDPKLMAGGISQALITTVMGLVVAVPLLFSHAILQAKAKSLLLLLTQQSAGLMAMHIERVQQKAHNKADNKGQ